MNPDNFNMSEQELNAQRRRRAENFKLNIDESEYEDDNFVKSEDEPSNLNSYSGQDVKKQMARESKQVLKQKKKEEKKALKAKNKYNRRTFRFIWIVSVLIVGAMAAVYMITGMNDLLAVNRTDSSTVKIEIPENPTVDDVTKVLVDNKVIGEPSYFKLFVNVTKSADDFTQGTYEIRRNMDYEAIINFLSSSNNRTDTVSVTITEGESVLEIADTLKKNGALGDRDEFLSLCNSEKFDSDFDFIKAETNADKRYYKLEGYLYPDTYEFYRNENAESVIYKFLNNYETKINEKQTVDGYSKKTTVLKMVEESDTKYSLDQVMTIASIIQAEAADKEDMYYISSILHNRLTASPFIFLIFLIKLSHSLLLGSTLSKCKCLQTCTANPFFSNIKGTSYKILALLFSITFSLLTLQNIAIFSFIELGIGSSVLHTKISGFIPIDCNSFTECCVGFDFNSFVPKICGNNVTCIYATSSGNFSNPICLIASIKGKLSISPTVPPISVITTSIQFFLFISNYIFIS